MKFNPAKVMFFSFKALKWRPRYPWGVQSADARSTDSEVTHFYPVDREADRIFILPELNFISKGLRILKKL